MGNANLFNVGLSFISGLVAFLIRKPQRTIKLAYISIAPNAQLIPYTLMPKDAVPIIENPKDRTINAMLPLKKAKYLEYSLIVLTFWRSKQYAASTMDQTTKSGIELAINLSAITPCTLIKSDMNGCAFVNAKYFLKGSELANGPIQ